MKSALQVEDAPKAIGPYVQAQVVRLHGGQKLVYTAGQVGLDPKTGELVPGGIQAETRRVMQNLAAVLRGANPPSRTTIAAAGLPRNARVEIECVAVGRDV